MYAGRGRRRTELESASEDFHLMVDLPGVSTKDSMLFEVISVEDLQRLTDVWKIS